MSIFYREKKYTPPHFTTEEIAFIFPEMPEVVKEKIHEYKSNRSNLIERMRLFAQRVEEIAIQEKKTDFFVWFWAYAYLKHFYAPQVVQIDRQLQRLYRQRRLFIISDNEKAEIRWDELKERAKNQSLHDIALPHLENIRQKGNRITALCPFHKEKTPSFAIFLNQNAYHCFGCQANGDSIDFLMKIEKIGFKEAVRRLAT